MKKKKEGKKKKETRPRQDPQSPQSLEKMGRGEPVRLPAGEAGFFQKLFPLKPMNKAKN